MRKITINGLEIECDDNVELPIEGNKVVIKAAPVEKVVHEHHYHHWTISSPLQQPFIGSPVYPTWGTGTATSPPLPNITVTANGGTTDPPLTSGYVQVINPKSGPFVGGGSMTTGTLEGVCCSDNLNRM